MGDEQRTVNIEEHPNYELGDTHFTVTQIANETGLNRSCITQHLQAGRLKDCTTVVLPGTGSPFAVEYDAALHDFFEQPRSGRIDRQRMIELLQTHTPREVSDALGCTRSRITQICAEEDYEVPEWGYQWKREAACTRQIYAQTLSKDGYSNADIANALDCHLSTVSK